MVLLAAFQALLARWTGERDVWVGTPVANRPSVELEGLIGLFVNTLVLRADLSGRPGFREVVARVREAALGAYAHQDVPFERLVEELAPRRDLSRSPLFQVMLAFQSFSSPATAGTAPPPMGAVTAEPLETGPGAVDLDVSLAVSETVGAGEGGLGLRLDYAADLFDATTVARFLGQLERLLRAAVEAPEVPVAEISLLSPAERHQLLAEWSDTGRPEPWRSIPERVWARVAERPDAVAIASEAGQVSYEELGRRAEALAAALLGQGVGPEVRVAIALERSVEQVVAALAVLRAGGAYVPLDRTDPEERRRYVLADSGARVLLARDGAESWADGGPAVLSPDAPPETPAPAPAWMTPGPDALAYVIYTSGSTGRPKGVAVRHGGLVNRLSWAESAYPLGPADRVLQKASFSVDVSASEILGTLSAGGRLVLAAPEREGDGAYLVRVILEQGVTLVDLVPSVLRILLETEGIEACRSLRSVTSGGEALPADLKDRFFERLSVPLRNQYGPTEITIDTTEWLARPGAVPGPVSLGRAIANTRLRVLDASLRPAPLGVAGELCVGGSGVARGYLDRPALTAERFVPDPWGEPGARAYRTGDLARHRADGELDFLGRIDHQVKVRGFRVEVGEVESVLREHPRVAEAAVVVRSEVLVAYVVGVEGEAPPAEALREQAVERLPGHMVPSAWVALAELPLTPSGKVDRRALPAPERGAEGSVAPRTGVEQVMAALWSEVLGSAEVGVEESFFALGGHSLRATRLVSRIRDTFGVSLPVRAIFESPTVAGLARRVEEMRRADGPPPPPVEPAGDVPPVLSFAQERLWFLDSMSPGEATYNVPHPLRIDGPLAVPAFVQALGEVMRRHRVLRTGYGTDDEGRVSARVLPAEPPRVPRIDLGGLAGPDREAAARDVARASARRPFDLARPPLLRAALARIAATGADDPAARHLLALTIHHVVTDAWSRGILFAELAALYQAFSAGRPSPLPELAVQYEDFARWQREQLSGERLERHVRFWRELLAGGDEILDLPTDRPRPPAPS
jgi:amino acid adenylation domain-containing protein